MPVRMHTAAAAAAAGRGLKPRLSDFYAGRAGNQAVWCLCVRADWPIGTMHDAQAVGTAC